MHFFSQVKAHLRESKVFLVYIISILILALGLQFVVLVYGRILRSQQSPAQLIQRASLLMIAAQQLAANEANLVSKGPVRKGLHVKFVHAPPANTLLIARGDRVQLAQVIKKTPHHFALSIALGAGRWLVLRHNAPAQNLLFGGFILLYIILWLGIIGLLWAMIRQFIGPLRQFARAALRFGVDMRGPPVAVAGPAELQQAIVAFNTMQEQVRRLINDRTQMLAAISHDLRTPITRLQLRLQWMPDQYRQAAIDDVEEMERMIHSILSFAQDYNSQEVATRFDMNALLETICDDNLDLGHTVAYQGAGRVLYEGRMLALKRAFSNLIDNAIKYGGQVEVSLQAEGDTRLIKITDRGPGIAEADLEKVFRPFYRLDRARTSGLGGSGLGLAVSRDIVRAHGGDIQLRNLPSKGLQVKVTLPCLKK